VARFTSSCAGLTCSFDASTSTALSTATYAWTFGDGQSGAGKTPSHTYGSANTYTVILTVTDANGTSDPVSHTVTPVASSPAPVASFAVDCASGRTCAFDASATTNASSYAWTFGDGTSASGVTASHTYTPNGTFTATLTATGAGGSNSTSKVISCVRKVCTGP
jgi:PKD repeat protein